MHSNHGSTLNSFIKKITSYERIKTKSGEISTIEAAFENEVQYHLKFMELIREFNCAAVRIPKLISFDKINRTIEMEFVPGVLLIDLPEASAVPWEELKRFIEYCESKDCYHNDLTEENLMLSSGAIYIIDFGMASDVNNDEITGSQALALLQKHYS